MNSIIVRTRKVAAGMALAGVLLTMAAAPSFSEGPFVPSPKLPPPSNCVITSDGSVLYPDGCILYPDGYYVYPSGVSGHL